MFICGKYRGTAPLRPELGIAAACGPGNARDYWAGARPNPGTHATGMAADRAPAHIPWLAGFMANARQ
jgi:hypothetical protein